MQVRLEICLLQASMGPKAPCFINRNSVEVREWVSGMVGGRVCKWVSESVWLCLCVCLCICVSLCVCVYLSCIGSAVAQRLSDGAFRVETISIIFQQMNSQTLKRCHFVNIWPILMILDAKCKYVSRSVFCRPPWAQKRPASLTEIALKFVSEWVGWWVGECVSEWVRVCGFVFVCVFVFVCLCVCVCTCLVLVVQWHNV